MVSTFVELPFSEIAARRSLNCYGGQNSNKYGTESVPL